MGRGRQKAKQTKVARQLKYSSRDPDYSALQRELAGSSGEHATDDSHTDDDLDEDEDLDEDDDEDEDDEYAGWSAHRGR